MQQRHYNELLRGDCKGADDQAHDIAEAAGLEIYIHPTINPAKRAFRVTHISRTRQKTPIWIATRILF